MDIIHNNSQYRISGLLILRRQAKQRIKYVKILAGNIFYFNSSNYNKQIADKFSDCFQFAVPNLFNYVCLVDGQWSDDYYDLYSKFSVFYFGVCGCLIFYWDYLWKYWEMFICGGGRVGMQICWN